MSAVGYFAWYRCNGSYISKKIGIERVGSETDQEVKVVEYPLNEQEFKESLGYLAFKYPAPKDAGQ